MKLLKAVALTAAMSGLCLTSAQAAVTQVEGQAGGGIVPWALLSAGAPTVSATWVDTGDYTLSTVALQAGIAKWVELSAARMTFDAGDNQAYPVGQVDVDIIGAKVKVLDMSNTLPAVAVGAQYKETSFNALAANGVDDSGVDFYVAATKIMPVAGKKMLLNATLRATKANQLGILGFGSAQNDDYEAMFEASVGVFLNDKTVLGVEYRMKPDNIRNINPHLHEDDWGDLFFAYFPTKNMSIVVAYAEFGDIAVDNTQNDFGRDQRGLYFQVQGNF